MRLVKSLGVIATLMMVAYPLLVYAAIQTGQLSALLPVLALLLIFRALRCAQQRQYLMLCVALAGVGLLGVAQQLDQHQWVLWYPVMMNVGMLSVFGYSLQQAQPLIERFARLRQPDIPESARPYLRRVTQAWCLFFMLNGGIATITILLGDLDIWALYNGLLAYIGIALMIVGEWIYRYFFIQPHRQA